MESLVEEVKVLKAIKDQFCELYEKFCHDNWYGVTYGFQDEKPEIPFELKEFLQNWLIHRLDTYNDEIQELLSGLIAGCGEELQMQLFRGCKKLTDGVICSYSGSIEIAAKFAGVDGFIVARDPEYCFTRGIRFSDYCFWLTHKFKIDPKLESTIAEYLGEDEIWIRTDLGLSTVSKVVQLSGLA